MAAVYSLEGYLLFGTAHRLVQRIEAALDAAPRPRHVLIDFRRVRGLDTLGRAGARAAGRGLRGQRSVALHLARAR